MWFSNNKQRKTKIFCISFQRTGTTSQGQFFKDFGYNVADYTISKRNKWTSLWFRGDYDAIFDSTDFRDANVYEDDPWWCNDFYKYLFHRFPKSKFVLFTRDPDRWFDSMVAHSDGKTLGNTHRHSVIYRREEEYFQLKNPSTYTNEIDNLLPLSEKHRGHYTSLFNLRNEQILDYFNTFGKERLFHADLDDDQKWVKMGSFFNIKVESGYDTHQNSSK